MNTEPKKEAGELEWLDAVKRIFARRSKETPPLISQSEIETLLLGLQSQERIPLTGTPLSPIGKKTVEMLQGYLDIMKKKKKKFLPIKA